MKRVLFIYNRHAGKNKTWGSLSDMINAMVEVGCFVTAYPTQYRGDAGDAIVRWGNQFDQVVVAGGDGTLSEAIAKVIRMEKPPLIGYIPVGTTNDFSKNLNLPLDSLTDLAVTAVTGEPMVHDLGKFEDKTFLYVAAFGAFTEVSYTTPQRAKNVLGYNAYMLEAARKLIPNLKPHHVKLEYDGNTIEGDYLYGMVSNTTSVGRFRNFPPGNPDLSDGLLEVTLISAVRDVKEMEELSRALLLTDPGQLTTMLHTFSARKVKITCEDGMAWTIDGENGGRHQTVEIDTLHHAYTIRHGDRPLPENAPFWSALFPKLS